MELPTLYFVPDAFCFDRAALRRNKLVSDLLVGWSVLVCMLCLELARATVVAMAGEVVNYVVVLCDIPDEFSCVVVAVEDCDCERALKPILPSTPNVEVSWQSHRCLQLMQVGEELGGGASRV